jgi:hypothetical protein
MLPDREMLDRTARLVQVDFCPNLSIEEIVTGLTIPHVEISADAASCKCRAGQMAVLSCAIQVAQLGASLDFSLPQVRSQLAHLPLHGDSLKEVVISAVSGIRPAAFSPGRARPAFEIVIGDGTNPDLVEGRAMYFGGDGFSCKMLRGTPPPIPWEGSWPFGGIAAGVIAAAEVFCASVRNIGGEALSLAARFDLQERQTASFFVPPLSPAEAVVGQVDFASAGAITNGALFTLLEVPGLSAAIRLFDDDDVALSNLNRCGLFDRKSIGSSKVEALARFSTSEIQIKGIMARLDESTLPKLSLAEVICIGTDSVAARWDIQRHAPKWVCVGATSHMMALVSRHCVGDPCVGCLHPRDEDDAAPIPTVSFVSTMAGMLQAYSLIGRSKLRAGSQFAYPHALGSPDAFLEIPVAANPACPVMCRASRAAVAL